MTLLRSVAVGRSLVVVVFSLIATCNASAQQAQPPAAAPAPASPPPAPQQQFQSSGDWDRLPRMMIERQFAGPLRDTVIQRLRDPVDGTICYIYLPISAPHSQPQSNGFVKYGSNTIGSINCVSGPPRAALPPAAQRKQ